MSIVIENVERWLVNIVIDLNLCPFAKREYIRKRIRFQQSQATSEDDLLRDLAAELALLEKTPEIETTLLIHAEVLCDFDDYNQFLQFADQLIDSMNLEGEFQIASFHPDYMFAGTASDDAENYTNRAPYPMLHILRESSLEAVISQHADTEKIPQDNIRLMNKLGRAEMAERLGKCIHQ